MSELRLEGVVKRYGPVVAVERVDLHIHEGEFLTLLGPSGCGKTTTLRMIAGFIEPTAGRILIGQEDVTGLPPQKRNIGMVFQDYALFPHLTIAENISFSLVERKVPTAQRRQRVAELLELIQLPGVAERYPAELSGGQQQRVALARAIAHPPRVLLMDEPLGALDLKLREAMQEELRALQNKLRITTVYVTHDQGEAMTLSDRIAVMNAGRVEQLDTPAAIYGAPRTEFVANFVGKINFLRGTLDGSEGGFALVDTPVGRIRAASLADGRAGPVTVSIRPENLRLLKSAAEGQSMNMVEGRILGRLFTGNLSHVRIAVAGDLQLLVEVRPSDLADTVADKVCIGWRPEHGVLIQG
jgi:spermidine/putrescine ABC transporter ATP-binding subunit